MHKTCYRLQTATIAFGLAILAGIFGIDNAHADWRKDIGIFRIGIITTEQSIEALDRLEPFKLAI